MSRSNRLKVGGALLALVVLGGVVWATTTRGQASAIDAPGKGQFYYGVAKSDGPLLMTIELVGGPWDTREAAEREGQKLHPSSRFLVVQASSPSDAMDQMLRRTSELQSSQPEPISAQPPGAKPVTPPAGSPPPPPRPAR